MIDLTARHIQNFSEASGLEPHWGYADRAVPCTNDAGSCEYLDAVYGAHDRGMLYMGIFWATIGGILLVWGVGRRFFETSPSPSSHPRHGGITRLRHSIAATSRQYLLPTSITSIFGHVPRLQVAILLVLTGYLTIWTFMGITYKKWITPVKGQPGVYNTRTSLGPWSDRIGVVAYALTPLSVLLASRENLLSLVTGVPYTSFIFLHRWTGYIIVIQSVLHTVGWVIIEARLYQPQPDVWNDFAPQLYIVWGFVALGLLVLMWLLALPVMVRKVTGYEFFRKTHYVLAMVYIGALIGHWQALQCFLVPGLVLWFLDRAARFVRMAMLHYGYKDQKRGWGFSSVPARARVWTDEINGDIVRLDFAHLQQPYKVGQHFFLCFTEGSIWQSHPLTPLSLPDPAADGTVPHAYIIRAKKGETRRIAELLRSKAETAPVSAEPPTTPVILQGPYGEDIGDSLGRDVNVLCVAGGTGITYVLPPLLKLIREKPAPGRKVELVWAVRREQDLEWIGPELAEIRGAAQSHGVAIRVFVTAEAGSEKGPSAASIADEKSPAPDIEGRGTGIRPNLDQVVKEFVGEVVAGPTAVFASGPVGMITDLRTSVAACNSGAKVWRGEERFDVKLVCDNRLEW
ncbi:putative ferric reductase transmembrane component [Phialemonium atrogriseum]|uniref:Ferric reductase transmembrane component n=1 Tax=Phialemonium atrogriseum TaxID=1093897 RepID=A0AAJ0BQK7_9PEZI|nr:putative ferric reductase transmembrane component [Phialemonium atrogriseum]KAK1762653.1 putative ferric reductase transmembrane component [Phialemonium atrogriseum]